MLSSVEAPKIENKTGGAQLSCSKDQCRGFYALRSHLPPGKCWKFRALARMFVESWDVPWVPSFHA